jgi:hypothetical protein
MVNISTTTQDTKKHSTQKTATSTQGTNFDKELCNNYSFSMDNYNIQLNCTFFADVLRVKSLKSVAGFKSYFTFYVGKIWFHSTLNS